MLNGLSRFNRTLGSIRRMLVTASVVAVIGLTGVTGARTIERKSAKTPAAASASRTLPKTQPMELLRSLPTDAIGNIMPRVVMMEVTAYCACPKCCGPEAMGITASGKDVTYNDGKFVAADRKLPFGTRLVIPGYSEQPVEVIDRGGAIKGDKLDVFFPSHEAALEWGRQLVPVTILN
jgi:3D (Asp-Asp-Asp) domain-containing protein